MKKQLIDNFIIFIKMIGIFLMLYVVAFAGVILLVKLGYWTADITGISI